MSAIDEIFFQSVGIIHAVDSSRDRFKKIMADHVARRPALDVVNSAKGKKAHKEWVALARIEQTDPRYRHSFR